MNAALLLRYAIITLLVNDQLDRSLWQRRRLRSDSATFGQGPNSLTGHSWLALCEIDRYPIGELGRYTRVDAPGYDNIGRWPTVLYSLGVLGALRGYKKRNHEWTRK